MAEINLTVTLKFDKAGLTGGLNTTATGTLTTNEQSTWSQDLTTVAELVAFPADVIAEGVGLVAIKNNGDTNNILVSTDNGATYAHKLLPGDPAFLVRCNSTAGVDPQIKIKAAASTTTALIAACGANDLV